MHKDINVNVSGPMQPASTYKTKILKGNHSFASQVTEPNTKYVIKHNFDLGGESITIPENCILEFDGGSLSNGTINGDSYKISSPNYKIFDNINFTGDARESINAHIEWFVGNYEDEYIEVGKNASPELNAAFNNGLIYWSINEPRFYYLKSTIVINKVIYIRANCIPPKYPSSKNPNIDYYVAPCFYSHEIVTLFEYHHTGVNGDKGFGSDDIRGLYLYVTTPYTELTDEGRNTPVFHLINEDNNLGCYLDINIHISMSEVQPDWATGRGKLPNYTGIYIDARNYMVFVAIDGNIFRCYRAYKFTATNPYSITDVNILGESTCAIGCDTNVGGQLKIHKSHQAVNYFPSGNGVSYFDMSGTNVLMLGIVHDLGGQTSGINCYKCSYGVRSLGNFIGPDITPGLNPAGFNRAGSDFFCHTGVAGIWEDANVLGIDSDSLFSLSFSESKLNDTTFQTLLNNELLYDLQYLVNGGSSATLTQDDYPSRYGKQAKIAMSAITKGVAQEIKMCYVRGDFNSVENAQKNRSLILTVDYVGYATLTLNIYGREGQNDILLETYTQSTENIYSMTRERYYFTRASATSIYKIEYVLSFTVPTNKNNLYFKLPNNICHLLGYRLRHNPTELTKIEPFKRSANGIVIGYSESRKKPYISLPDTNRDAMGNLLDAPKKGAFADKSCDVAVGFVYFNESDGGKPIFFDGNGWVDATGSRLSWLVNYSLTYTSTSDTRRDAENGNSYITTLIPNAGYHLRTSIAVKMGTTTLSSGTDYTYSIDPDTGVGTVTILGTGGSGGVTDIITIIARSDKN